MSKKKVFNESLKDKADSAVFSDIRPDRRASLASFPIFLDDLISYYIQMKRFFYEAGVLNDGIDLLNDRESWYATSEFRKNTPDKILELIKFREQVDAKIFENKKRFWVILSSINSLIDLQDHKDSTNFYARSLGFLRKLEKDMIAILYKLNNDPKNIPKEISQIKLAILHLLSGDELPKEIKINLEERIYLPHAVDMGCKDEFIPEIERLISENVQNGRKILDIINEFISDFTELAKQNQVCLDERTPEAILALADQIQEAYDQFGPDKRY